MNSDLQDRIIKTLDSIINTLSILVREIKQSKLRESKYKKRS
tara:strand:+ start:7546 stop:7671 length:126 start_codon:yes stop_codon:yes gene_type:complete